MRFFILSLGSLACAATVSIAHAAPVVTDPTRPPAILDRQGDEASAETMGKPVLQSVIISPGRKLAIISGQTLKLGDRYGDARLVKITETEVVLRTENEYQSLKLYPHIEKKTSANRPRPGARGEAK